MYLQKYLNYCDTTSSGVIILYAEKAKTLSKAYMNYETLNGAFAIASKGTAETAAIFPW